MPDRKLLEEWFNRIDADIRFLVDCFAEVLEELDQASYAGSLPWRSSGETPDPTSETVQNDLNRELQVLSIGYHLLNIVEESAASQARRQREKMFGILHEPGLWGSALQRLKNEGHQPEDIAKALADVNVEIVLTAHPTEAKRPAVLRQHRALFDAFTNLKNSELTAGERDAIREQIKVILERLWRTGEMYLEKPDVFSELEHIVDYFLAIFPAALPEMRRRFEHAWTEAGIDAGVSPDKVPGPQLRFGSWVGGDRDGHPLVTPEVTAETLLQMRRGAIQIVHDGLHVLLDNLTLSDLFQDPPAPLIDALAKGVESPNGHLYPHEPWRRWVGHMIARLTKAQEGEPGGYASPEELNSDLEILRTSLEAVGADRLVKSEITPLSLRLDTFGFHLAALDIRQNSELHATAASDMLRAAGLADWDFASWDAAKRFAFLERELTTLRPLVPRDSTLGDEARNVLGYFQVVADHITKYGSAGIGTFIVSMTKSASDLLVVYLFAREVGLLYTEGDEVRCKIEIAPLFETYEDLENAAGIMSSYFSFPVTQNSFKAHQGKTPSQQIMIGYSDSNKDVGIFASHWVLHCAQQSMTKACHEFGVEVTFFHGRGGTFSRGAGPVHRFLGSLPDGSVSSAVRMTEQGETIAQKYGNLPTAVFNFELLLAGVADVVMRRRKVSEHDAALSRICDRLAEWSSEAYQNLLASEDFIEFWESATPIDALELSFIGSRPTRRTGKRTIDDLRAIPWVFSWAQSRFYITGWFGVGTALDRLQREAPEDYVFLKTHRAANPFVDYVFLNSETSNASASVAIMTQYSSLVSDETIRERHLNTIANEHRLSEAMLNDFFDSPRTERRPRLVKTLDMRAEGLERLHARQIELLRKWRKLSANGHDKEASDMFPLLLLSINAIAGAERTTG
jgi:phosphoenolpyruvate carboxylase